MKCLDQQGLKYLWSLIKDNFATSAEVSNNEAVLSGLAAQLSGHTGNTGNPHNVTKAQIGLGDFTYEEGTFSPTLSTSFSGPKYTPNVSSAAYKRVGNMVHIKAQLSFQSSLPSAWNLYLHGLPAAINPKDYAGDLLNHIYMGHVIVNISTSNAALAGTGAINISLPEALQASDVRIDLIYWI